MAKTKNSKEDAALEKAASAYQSGDFARVVRVFELTAPKHRTSALWQVLVGAALCRLSRFKEAEPFLVRSVMMDPYQADAYTWLALIHAGDADSKIPLSYAQKAVELRPNDASGFSVLGQVNLKQNRPEEAYEPFKKAAILEPRAAVHRHNLGQCCLALQKNDEAISHLKKATELAPADAQNYLALAGALMLFGFLGDAIACLQEGIAKCPQNAQFHTSLASCYTLLRNDEEAEFQHQQAEWIDSRSAITYGAWLVNQGRFEESNEIFWRAIEEGHEVGFSLYNLMLSRKLKPIEEDLGFLEKMKDHLAAEQGVKGEMYLRYALGRASEQLKHFDEAAEHFERANELAFGLHKQSAKISEDKFKTEVDEQIRTFEALRDQISLQGRPTESPIFIVGMIRSGTTLLDQILSSHSKVSSVGELRFWLEESKKLALRVAAGQDHHLDHLAEDYMGYSKLLSQAKDRVSDKMPLNFSCLGAISLALPKAKFVHIKRHPLDTCLSIWTTYFGQGPSFGYNKERIVNAYQAYLYAMDYWREALGPDQLIEVDYESIISNPREEISRIVEFLDLDWEEACLHHDQNKSAINTPSRWQARQPLYASSVQRWRSYEPWLGHFSALTGSDSSSSSA